MVKVKGKPSKQFKKAESDSNDSNDEEKQVGSLLRNPGKIELCDSKQIESGIEALFKVFEKTSKNTKQLFDDEQPIYLQIACMKIPKVPKRILRLPLKHSLLNESSEICLIVPDLNRKKPKEYEEAVEHYEQLLHDKGIMNVKTIIPLHQLKSEYGQFELKRRLVELYDIFLVDGRISGKVFHLLGSTFFNKKKSPNSVKMSIPNLKEHFENMLSRVQLQLHSNGDNYSIQVAHTKMSREAIFENVVELLEELSKSFPGGFNNIRSLNLKTPLSISIPIFVTLKNNSEVQIPIVKAKRPKVYGPIIDELPTKLNSTVKVYSSGKVLVRKMKQKKRFKKNVELK